MAVTIDDHIFEASAYLGKQEQARFIFALVDYGMNGTLPDAKETWYPLFIVARTDVDLSSNPGRQLARKRWNEQATLDELKEAKATYHSPVYEEYYAQTAYSENYMQRWSDEEDKIVLDRKMSDSEIAKTLGRSLKSIHQRRSVLKKMLGDNA